MKPELHEMAAWKAFGMMPEEDRPLFDTLRDADPSIAASEREMDNLATTIAVICAAPLTPSSDTLEKIKLRCGLVRPTRPWLRPLVTWSGWGVAAALALWISFHPTPPQGRVKQVEIATAPDISSEGAAPMRSAESHSSVPEVARREGSPGASAVASPQHEKPSATALPSKRSAPSAIVIAPQTPVGTEPAENRRLIQEIERLREQLAKSEQIGKDVFAVAPRRAWPIIIEMTPPGNEEEDEDALKPSLASRLGDAIAGKPHDSAAANTPSAIPIYDPARDVGTIALMNLPPAPNGHQYDLWVTTANATEPVFVGTLPREIPPTATIDFALGTTGVIVNSFGLTLVPDNIGSVPPNPNNTVLIGP